MARIRVGTSGWHYKHWRGTFYPTELPVREWLAYYAERLDSVEVNNSFYHLLPIDTAKEWRAMTPRQFLFAVKGSRYITHMRRLKEPKESLRRFFEHVRPLREKLGPVVFQLPPRWQADPERLRAFLRALPKTRRFAFEFRDPAWHNEEIYSLLREYRAAFCIYQLAGFRSPLVATTDIVYVRLHGPGGKYQGNYSARALAQWATRALEWQAEGREVFIYFDNDQAGYAAKNAIALRRRIEKRG